MGSRILQFLRHVQRPLMSTAARDPAPVPAHADAAAAVRGPTLNHVALAVPSLPAASAFYRDVLGLKVSAAQPLPEHGVTVSFVDVGESNIELLEPLGEASPIARFLRNRPAGGMHHLCIDVDNLSEAINVLRTHGVRTLADPKIGAHGKRVVFLHPADAFGSLIELQQR